MVTISASEARRTLSSVIETAQEKAVFIARHGEPEAVVISADEYHRLLEIAEENEDVSAFDAAMVEEGDSIPWHQVKQDLGWSE